MIEHKDIQELILEYMEHSKKLTTGGELPEVDDKASLAEWTMRMAAETANVINLAINMARSENTLEVHDLTDLMREKLNAENPAWADWIKEVKIKIVLDGEGEAKYAAFLVSGSSGRAPWKGDQEARHRVYQIILDIVSDKIEHDLSEFIDVGDFDDQVDKRFKATVERTQDLTEQEVEKFRSEIDSIFPTAEGGGT